MADPEYAELWLKQHYDPEDGSFTVVERPVTGRDGSEQTSFTWGVYPLGVKGILNTKTLQASILVTLDIHGLGPIRLVNLNGNLKDGLSASIDLAIAKGRVSFYLKNGNELWTEVKVSALRANTGGTYKILTI